MVATINPENWVNEHGDYLYNYAMGRLYSKDLAEDILQETFLYAYRNRELYSGNSSERTWLTAILKRKIVDHYRRKSSKKERSVKFDSPFIEESFMHGHWDDRRVPQKWNADEEELSKDPAFMNVLNKCISFLPEKWRAVFTLKHVDEASNNEISETLQVSDSNIWTILHRSRLKLRECIERLWFKK